MKELNGLTLVLTVLNSSPYYALDIINLSHNVWPPYPVTSMELRRVVWLQLEKQWVAIEYIESLHLVWLYFHVPDCLGTMLLGYNKQFIVP